MNEYYGVPTTSTSDYLAHYGVKGMRWGVRKAIERGNQRALDRHYAKAQRKLNKLYAKANPKALLKKADSLDRMSRKARMVGRVGLGAATVGTGLTAGVNHIYRPKSAKNIESANELIRKSAEHMKKVQDAKKYIKTVDLMGLNAFQDNFRNVDIPQNLEAAANARKQAGDIIKRNTELSKMHNKIDAVGKYAQVGGAGLAGLGYGTAIVSKIRANSIRKRVNNKAKMNAARRDAENFRNEMNAVFSGTKYKKKK